MATNTNILFPQTPFIDPSTGRPSLPWVLWLQNPSFVNVNLANALPIASGGTGISTAPTNGQLLIGNAGNYTLHTLSTGSGIGITNGAGLITVANTGVLSNIASSGISVSGATGNVTIANTGVLSAIAGSGISVSGATGNVTFANTGVLSFSGGSTGLTPATATTGAVSLAGTLAVAYGGTGQTTYTDGQLLIGNTTGNTLAKSTLTAGTGISITNGHGSITVTNTSPSSGGTVTSVSVVSANGLAGTVATATTTPAITLSTTITGLLKGNGTAISAATSGTDYAPATSGTSILYGNGSGGFSNVTIGSGISFATGTLSATGSGGTVTSVAALTLGTTGTDLSSTVANGTTTPVITLNVPTASATNRGALSSTDWTTFNNKGSGSVTSVSGTGTVNGITLTGTVTSSGSLTLGGTLGSIANSQLSNSTISGVSLGSNLFSLTAGTGVSFSAGTTYNGSAAITITATGSGGTVTSVTGTAPVVSSGGTTPAISMAAATTSVNGYLTSTDWTTFNGKQAALVSGTNIKTVNGTTLLGSGDVGTITYAYGGTGQTTVTTGDVLYGSATNTWSKLGIGTTGQILRVVAGAPAWGTDYVGTVTSVGGTGTVNGITLTGTVTSSGNLTLGGTLGSIANSQLSNSAVTIGSTSISLGATSTTLAGLTGVTSSAITDSGLTSGRVTYATTGGLLTDSANLTFSGSALAITGNLTSTTAQFGANPAGVSIGVIGIPNQKRIYGRNAANSADVNILYVDGSNGVVFGPSDSTVFDASGNLTVSGNVSIGNGAYNISGSSAAPANGMGLRNKFGFGLQICSANPMGFSVDSGTSNSMVLDTSGNLTFSTGNLVQGTAAKGINFTANTPASGMTSQLLNWYEEGTWTPTYVAATGTLGTVTYANVQGRYTRVGRLVTATGGFYCSAFAAGTGSGDLRITGLPFTNSANVSAISVGDSRLFTLNNPTGGQVGVSATYITLFYRTTANGAINNLQVSDAATGSGALNLVYFTASYQI